MRALVFGQSGQVARELALRCPAGVSPRFLSRAQADLTDPTGCAAIITEQRPDVVINAAAYTAVDQAEAEEALAQRINAQAPGAMAQACAALGVPFVHISSDYVFDGAGSRAWRPDDAPAPVSAYGRSKLGGERAVWAAGGVYVILRTSWVVSAHGQNFVKTMLRLGAERDQIQVVADQVGGPTPARAIAEALWVIAGTVSRGQGAGGIYHFSGGPDVSWAQLARAILTEAGLRAQVIDIPAHAYPTAAHRPANSRLDCRKTETVFGLPRPDWRVGLRQILHALKEPVA